MRKPTYNRDHDIRWQISVITGRVKRETCGRRWKHRKPAQCLQMSKVDGEEG